MTSIETNDASFQVVVSDNGASGATATFPYDRSTIERFRTAFPRARWRDDLRAWFVPGTTAGRRLDRWLGRELAGRLAYDDDRGRDAFAFDPIESRYLRVADDFQVRTPYSRTIIDELRAVPWAWWDDKLKTWRIPFRSWDELRRRWAAIEMAAQRNEPEERQKRRESRKLSANNDLDRERRSERRRLRYPVAAEALPPLGRILMTLRGAVIFVDLNGEIADQETVARHYSGISSVEGVLTWASWRKPSYAELVRAWPSRTPANAAELAQGWWQPTLNELRDERRKARATARAQLSRRK